MAISRPQGRIRGYHAQKGEEGCVGSMALMWGRRVHQLLVQAEEEGPRQCGVEGESLVWRWLNSCLADWKGCSRAQSCLIDWKGRARSKLLGWMKGACTLKVAWLIETGARAKWEVWWFSSSFLLQLRVDENRSACGDTLPYDNK
jgi:hypothetical protein